MVGRGDMSEEARRVIALVHRDSGGTARAETTVQRKLQSFGTPTAQPDTVLLRAEKACQCR
jgi:hypothetical protein